MTPTALTPNPDLRSLERLVDTAELSGGVQGQVRCEWTDGREWTGS